MESDIYSEKELEIQEQVLDFISKIRDFQTIEDMLYEIGCIFESKRSYIFEFHEDGEFISKTYEWCAPRTSSFKDSLRNIPKENFELLFEKFKKSGAFYIENPEENVDKNSFLYKFLLSQSVKSCIVVPLNDKSEYAGFAGIDCPEKNTDQLMQLSILFVSVYNEILRRRSVDEVKKVCEQEKLWFDKENEMTIELLNGLSSEYNTIWRIFGLDQSMRLIRTGGKTVVKSAVDMVLQLNTYSEAQAAYINKYVCESDRERVLDATSIKEVLKNISSDKFYTVNYLRRADDGSISYQQMAFSKIICENGPDFLLAFRDIDRLVKEQNKHLEEEKKMQELILEQYDVFNALSNDYINIYKVDLNKGTIFNFGKNHSRVGNIDKMDDLSLEYDYSKLTGEYVDALVYSEDKEFCRQSISLDNIRKNLEEKNEYFFTYRTLNNGEIHHLMIRYIVCRKNKDDYNVIMGVRLYDEVISKELNHQEELKKALLEAQRANAAKTSFLSRMSHDIRTPLNGIIGLIEIGDKHSDNVALQNENREKARVAADHLLSLINDVLQMSKLEDGKFELAHEAVDLKKEFESIAVIIGLRAKENGISINFNYKASYKALQEPYVFTSPLHLRQILVNLYSNAIKYNKPGGRVSSIVSFVERDSNSITYRMEISDTGIGIGKEFMEHLFEPFSQEHNDARSIYNGTGLGMAIVKSLIDAMGGTINVESELGVGSKFTITIPFEIAKESDVKKTENANSTSNITGLKILLAEDNELNGEIAIELLNEMGAEVTLVKNGILAVEEIEKNPNGTFDVILMDIMMPEMNGYDATKKIRSMSDENKASIPIIAMTANAFDEDKREAFDAGMNAHIAKPFRPEKLSEVLSEVLISR